MADESLEQMKAEFVADASESVDRLAQRLAELDGAGAYPANLTDELFRRAHSLRGTAGMFGLDQVSTVAKSLENLLEAVRAGKVVTSAEILRLFVEALDELSALLRGEHLNGAGARQETVIQKIDRVLGESRVKAPAGPARTAAPTHAPAASGQTALSVKVPIEVLDSVMNTLAELFSARLALASATKRLPRESATRKLADDLLKGTLLLNKGLLELQAAVVGARLVPVSLLLSRYTGEVRRLARLTGKDVDLTCEGEATLIDRALLDKLYDPLLHIIRNAVDHGIEPGEERQSAGKPSGGRITLRATQEANHVRIDVIDDGRGIDMEAVRRVAARQGLGGNDLESLQDFIFRPGFTTRDKEGEISGRGVGLDAVRTQIEEIRGVVSASSEPGKGAVFSVWVPLTVAISKGMLVEEGQTPVAVPMRCVVEILAFTDEIAGDVARTGKIVYRGTAIPAIGLAQSLGGNDVSVPKSVVIMGIGAKRRALLVESVRGEVEIVTRPLPDAIAVPACIGGATELHDGRPALVMQPEEVLRADNLVDLKMLPAARASGQAQAAGPVWWKHGVPAKVIVFKRSGRIFGLPTEALEGIQSAASVTRLAFLGTAWEGIFFVKGLCYGLLRPPGSSDDRRSEDFEIIKFRVPSRCGVRADQVLGEAEVDLGAMPGAVEALPVPDSVFLPAYGQFIWNGASAELLDPAGTLRASFRERPNI